LELDVSRISSSSSSYCEDIDVLEKEALKNDTLEEEALEVEAFEVEALEVEIGL